MSINKIPKLNEVLEENSLGHLNIKEDYLLPEWYTINPQIEDNLARILTRRIPIRLRIGCGYYQEGKDAVPSVPILLELIKLLGVVKHRKLRTYREALEIIPDIMSKDDRTDATITSPGALSLFFSKIEKNLGIVDKETTEDRLLKLRAQRRARNGGKKTINYSKEVQKKQAISKELTETNKELKKIKAKERALKNKIVKKAKELNVKKDPTKYDESLVNPIDNVFDVTQEKIKELRRSAHLLKANSLVERYTEGLRTGVNEKILMEMYREIMEKKEKFNKRSIAFLPTPRQYQFLSAPEDIVLYGGAAG